jgi:hypothetical protein
VARAPRLPSNVEIRPACTQAEAAALMTSFSAGLIPFVINRLTRSVDPVKYYQYRAAGRPVLTTAFGDMAGRDATFLLNGDQPLDAVVRAALAYAPSIQAIERFRQENSWDVRLNEARLWQFR